MSRLATVAALSALALAACGGDDDAGGGGSGGNGDADGGNAPQRVEMSEFAFSPDEVQVESGEGVIAVNVGEMPHNLTIERGGSRDESGREVAATSDVAADAMERLAVDVPSGEYTLVCTVPGHREAGMLGTIVVE